MDFNEQENCLNEIREIELLYSRMKQKKIELEILENSPEVKEYFKLKKEVDNFEWLESLYKQRLSELKNGTAEKSNAYLELIKKQF